jgi:hypothetical protein
MNGSALPVQQTLGRDPHAGDLQVFRGGRESRTSTVPPSRDRSWAGAGRAQDEHDTVLPLYRPK